MYGLGTGGGGWNSGVNMEEIQRNRRRTLFHPPRNKNFLQYTRALSDEVDWHPSRLTVERPAMQL
jgi:hypothetical protein